jgi:hypothetical protein
VHDVFVRDGYLFTALWNDGMTIWDIGARGRGTPSAPDSIANVRTVGGQVHNLWWAKDAQSGTMRYAFVGEEGPGSIGASSQGDVHVVDVSDVTKPREVAVFGVPGAGTHNFSVDEGRGILYAAYYNGGVRAVDVRGDLGTCSAAEKTADGRCDLTKMGRALGVGLTSQSAYVWGVEYTADAVYASDMLGGLWVLAPVTREASPGVSLRTGSRGPTSARRARPLPGRRSGGPGPAGRGSGACRSGGATRRARGAR